MLPKFKKTVPNSVFTHETAPPSPLIKDKNIRCEASHCHGTKHEALLQHGQANSSEIQATHKGWQDCL